jgi:hypothetical protein
MYTIQRLDQAVPFVCQVKSLLGNWSAMCWTRHVILISELKFMWLVLYPAGVDESAYADKQYETYEALLSTQMWEQFA